MSFYDPNHQKISPKEVSQLQTFVRDFFGYDFTGYAPASFQRRVVRALEVFHFERVEQLIDYLQQNPEELEFFLSEITVGVTEMFRDPEAWLHFRRVLLPELANLPEIRIWHPGCSTGEEVFTLAILMKEEGLLPRLRQLATDIDTLALEVAQSGLYSYRKTELYAKNYQKFNPEGQLSAYYQMEGANVQMDLDLIDNVRFIEHDLVSQPPPGTFDVVFCRNVLIYFDTELQNRILQTFHAALKEGGLLILGHYESLVWCENILYFEPLSQSYNIFRSLAQPRTDY